MRHVRLIAVSDEFDRQPGLAVKGAPTNVDGFMADRDGVLIAHDLLEHVNGIREIGAVWDELEALGAIWQVRARHGDLFTGRPSYSSMESNIASDLTRMFADWIGEERYRGPRPITAGIRTHDYDSSFLECIAIARKDIPGEWGDGRIDAPELEHVESYLALALRCMRIGFRKAQRRYGTGFAASNMFVAIREAVATVKPEFEGQEFRLSYDENNAFVEEIWS